MSEPPGTLLHKIGTIIHIDFELSESLPILTGNVAYSWENAADPWLGEWIRVILNDGNVLQCLIPYLFK